MVNQELVDYIKKERQDGYTDEAIKSALVGQGIDNNQIQEAFSNAQTPNQSQTTPSNTTPQQNVKKRNPWLVLLFTIITLGIYYLFWLVFTTNELKTMSNNAPNPKLLFLLLIPFVGLIMIIYYDWKYSKALYDISGFNNIIMFILLLFIAPVGVVVAQYQLNKKATS